MPCSRGEANPDRHTTLRLFADSGGYCQRPECTDRLFIDTGTKNIHIAEMAHIIAAAETGPRSDASVAQAARGAYDNLILLCANCHTTIDKAPQDFPDGTIREWKRRHVDRINSLFGAREYLDRASAREAIVPALVENRAVFDQFGPHNDYRQDPESELASVWRRKVRAIILPNNRKLLMILDANRRHLREHEVETLETFRQHIDDLEAKHIGEGGEGAASRFPAGMSNILTEISHG
jgi:hypothetical protein